MTLRIHGNRTLKTLAGKDTRPTPSRVREAMFNIWHTHMADCRWLDLCAGSGAMGAEALCRGATVVVGIEQSGRACAVIRQNWQQVARPEQSITVMRGDVVKQLAKLANGQTQPFDRIYFDPPYASDLYGPVLEAIATYGLLSTHGELAAEHHRDRTLPAVIAAPAQQQPSLSLSPNHASAQNYTALERYRVKTYGTTAVAFYRHCE